VFTKAHKLTIIQFNNCLCIISCGANYDYMTLPDTSPELRKTAMLVILMHKHVSY